MEAIELLKNKFGVSQKYKHDVMVDGEVLFSVYWHPLTIAERESIMAKSGDDQVGNEACGENVAKSKQEPASKLCMSKKLTFQGFIK